MIARLPGHQQRAADALQGPGQGEPGGRGREGAEDRGHREGDEADHEHPPPPVAVAQRAAQEQEAGQRHQVAVEDPLQAGQVGVEVAADGGQGDVDDAAVEEGDPRPEHRGGDHPPTGRSSGAQRLGHAASLPGPRGPPATQRWATSRRPGVAELAQRCASSRGTAAGRGRRWAYGSLRRRGPHANPPGRLHAASTPAGHRGPGPSGCPEPTTAGDPARPRLAALLVVAVGLAFADASIVVLALPDLYREFDTSVVGVSWVLTAYAIVVTVAALLVALVGRRVRPGALTAAGLVVFAASSLAAGLAGSFGVLLAARCAQGVGAALLLAGAIPVLAALRGSETSGRAWWAWAGTIGAALGPALGGVLTQLLDWRAIFIVQAPVAAAALVVVAAPVVRGLVPARSTPRAPGSVTANLGFVLVFAALVGALFLSVLLVVEVWQYEPMAGALVVTALPVGTFIARFLGARLGASVGGHRRSRPAGRRPRRPGRAAGRRAVVRRRVPRGMRHRLRSLRRGARPGRHPGDGRGGASRVALHGRPARRHRARAGAAGSHAGHQPREGRRRSRAAGHRHPARRTGRALREGAAGPGAARRDRGHARRRGARPRCGVRGPRCR